MENFFSDFSANSLSNGLIEDVILNNNSRLITVSYNCRNCTGRKQTIRLVINNNTIIFNEFGNIIPPAELETGMIINATFSSAMTRSIPPQATAFVIHIVRRPVAQNNITIGRIIDIDRNFRNFTTISGNDFSSIIRFNVPVNTRILGLFGQTINFNNLRIGIRVNVRHANFMTASIPPQTTAFEVRVIR